MQKQQKPTKNPYYIVAPEFTRKSGGITMLYTVCHLLNRKGYRAFIVHEGMQEGAELSYPEDYQAPFLNEKEARNHIFFGYNPIVIRAEVGRETIHFPATFRYILNYIGMFPGEPKETDPEFQIDKKFFWAFSKDIAKRHNIPESRVMFTPIVDTEIFFPPKTENRKGKACYLGKYAEIFSNKLPQEIDKSFYIFYRNTNKGLVPTRKEYAEKLRNCEMIYIYENTSVITEALMCGCVVVCVPNDYCQFTEKDMIGLAEIGLNGIAIGTGEEEIKRAKETVHLARERILQLMQEFDKKIDYFIEETQKISHEIKINQELALRSLNDYFVDYYCQKNLTFSQKMPREIKRFLRNINIFGLVEDGVIIRIPYCLKSIVKRLKKLMK